jgi:cytoskeleton protein RodZ
MHEETSYRSSLEHIAGELKNARIKKNLSFEEISRSAGINKSHLEKIEEGDFAFLPKIYVFATLKSYARELGVGDDTLLEQCRKELQMPFIGGSENISSGGENVRVQEMQKKVSADEFSFLSWLGGLVGSRSIVVLIVALSILLFLFFIRKPPSAPPPIIEPTAQTPVMLPPSSDGAAVDTLSGSSDIPSEPIADVPPPAPVVTSPKAAMPADSVTSQPVSHSRQRLVVRIIADTSWVKVIADDSAKVYPGGRFPSGTVLRYEGEKKLWVSIGRPGNVELILNGKKIPPFTERTLVFE